jgi:hypothetical protein
MATPIYCVFDGDPLHSVVPIVPTVDEMGGAAFVDDDVFPPIEEENVMARDINQMQELLVRACRMIPKASFWVRKVTTVCTLLGFRSVNDLFLSSHVTVSESSGILTIRWPIARLPVATMPPMVSLINNSTMEVSAPVVCQSVDSTYGYARVTVMNSASLLDTFTVRVDVDGSGTFED